MAIKHGFGDRGRAVVQRRVGDLHARQLADHRLELEDVLKSALAELRLIRRVGGEEFCARDQRVDDDRDEVRVRARAEKRLVIASRCRRPARGSKPEGQARSSGRPCLRARSALAFQGFARRVLRCVPGRCLEASSGARQASSEYISFDLLRRLFLDVVFVLGRVQEGIDLRGVINLDADHPAVAVRVFVDLFGRVVEALVDFDDVPVSGI